MALRWTAAGMLEAEKQFRKIIGYRDRRRAHTDAARAPTKETSVLVTA
jgi:hypothetical protein